MFNITYFRIHTSVCNYDNTEMFYIHLCFKVRINVCNIIIIIVLTTLIAFILMLIFNTYTITIYEIIFMFRCLLYVILKWVM